MSRQLGLQGRLLLLLGAVMLITLLIVAVSVFVLVSSAEREVWAGRQDEAGRNAATQASNYINLARASLQFIAELDVSPAELERILRASADRSPGYLEFIVLNERGTVVSSVSAGESVLANAFTIAQSNWFVSARGAGEGQFYFGDVQISPQNVPYIIMSSPSRSGGVVALRLSLSVLGEIVSGLRFGTTGTTYVVQSEGTVAAHPDPRVIQDFVSLAGRQELEAVLEQREASWTGSYTNFRNEAVIGTASAIPNTNLVVITEIAQVEATASSRNALLVLGTITVLFWLGAIVLTRTTIRRLVFVPLQHLQEGANEVEQGNLQYQAKLLRHDEIGQLTESFNAMARGLYARASEREQLIMDLQRAKRQAEENSRLKSEFLSTMSHELRTPLNAIEGFTSIMLSRMGIELNPKAEEMVRRVSANSKRLLHLINDFLDLSRIESGRLELVKAPVSPAALARIWQSQVGVLGEEKGVEFVVTVDAALPPAILGDEDALTKIAINLLGNAFKFTHKGTVSLDLRRANRDWMIVVSDTGIGIPPHAREYIFEEFRQVDGSSKRLYGGTGLGLALVQKLTRAMGGSVTLQSELGRGSTFTITLPLEPGESEHEQYPARSA